MEGYYVKEEKALGLIAGIVVLMAAAPAAVSAKPTSGMDIIPVIDQNFWLAESKGVSNLPLDREGGYASATVTRAALSPSNGQRMPRRRRYRSIPLPFCCVRI